MITTTSANQRIKTLWRSAGQLRQASDAACGLPPLWFLTDSSRVADPMQVAGTLPQGAGIILRDYDHPERAELAAALMTVASNNNLTLLIGIDAVLASEIGAAGVHLPEAAIQLAPSIKRNHPDFVVTVSTHSLHALGAAARAEADAAFLSPVFPTRSHPRAKTLGPVRASRMAQQASLPVFALGGIDHQNLHRLKGSAFAGIGAIGSLAGA